MKSFKEIKNSKKFKIIALIVFLLILVILLNIGNNKNSTTIVVGKASDNYLLKKVSKADNKYTYSNKWQIGNSALAGELKIIYDEEKHTIKRENKINSEQFNDSVQASEVLSADLLLDNSKEYILVYNSGFIPYINKNNNKFGIIDSRLGYNLELEEGKKVIDVVPKAKQSAMQIYLNSDTTEKEKQDLIDTLNKTFNIGKITFQSKEDALNIMKEKMKNSQEILSKYEGENNIFPESYIVTLKDGNSIDNVKKQLEKMDINCIKKISASNTSNQQIAYREIFDYDLVIKDNTKFSFAATEFVTENSKMKIGIKHFEDTYLDIYVAQNNKKEVQGYIVEKNNNKKVFLDKYKDEITKEYQYINWTKINSEFFIVCSNSNIAKEEDLKNAEFEVFDVNGKKVQKDKSSFVELLQVKQNNYKNQDALEYNLFK